MTGVSIAADVPIFHELVFTFHESISAGFGELSPLRFHPHDLPDLVELSQKLQARLTEAFRNSPRQDTSSKIQLHQQHQKAYLSRDAALRLSERIFSAPAPPMRHPPARSRTRRRRFFMQSSHTFDDDNESTLTVPDEGCLTGRNQLSVSRESLYSYGAISPTHSFGRSSSLQRRRNSHERVVFVNVNLCCLLF